jgi:hypothetical protein
MMEVSTVAPQKKGRRQDRHLPVMASMLAADMRVGGALAVVFGSNDQGDVVPRRRALAGWRPSDPALSAAAFPARILVVT